LVSFRKFDLLFDDYSLFDEFNDIDTLIITAGFGKLSLFEDMQEDTIVDMISVNTTSVLRIIKHFYGSIYSRKPFYTAVMVSIAGFMSSPFFSVYGASKAALKIFIESVNVELKKSGTDNRILNVSPGRINGTNFYNGANNLSLLYPLADEIIYHMNNRNDLFIPEYEEVFKKVLERYHRDFRAEGEHSYEYKQEQLKRK
jgi:putative short-chain dehydrogenase/reductase family protein